MKSNAKKTEKLEHKVDELKQRLYDEQNKIAFTNAILEGGSLIIWAVNTELELISFNQNYFRHFLQKDTDSLIGYESRGKVKTEEAETFWKRKYDEARKGKSIDFEIRIEAGGWHSWKEVFLTPIYDSMGEIIGISGLAHDITEKMQSKINLIVSEEKFRNIFESFQDLYFRFDFDGKVIMLSPSVTDIIGYEEEEILGKDIIDYYSSSRKTAFLIRKLTESKSVRNFEADLLHKDGTLIHCICNIRIISDEEDIPLYVEGVARDISELTKTHNELQRSKEIVEKSLKVKERFLANMSHEIRTPLNGIMGMLHLLDESNLSGKQKDHLKALKSSSEVLLNILNDLLDLSKIEAGKMTINHSVVDSKELLNKIQLLYNQQAEQKQVTLTHRIDSSVPKLISSDETKLIQIYSNLVSNAIKFTPEHGTVHVELNFKKQETENTIILSGSVTDSGIGIDADDQEKIFSSFTQLDSSSSKSYKGTGLGLHISKKIIKLLNGDLQLKSEPGKGSTFYFTFQANRVTDFVPNMENNQTPPKLLQHQPKVLLVDDNKVNLDLALEILKNAGCKVTTANSGAKALKYCKNDVFDIILMDIQMPDMDGYQTTTKIKQECAYTPPIIAMTAYSIDSDKEKFIAAGMNDVVAKPIKPAMLIQKVEAWTSDDSTEEINIQKSDNALLSDIDMATLETLRKYAGTEVLNETLLEFDKECKQQLEDIRTTFKEKQFEETLVLLHTLKGNASTLGVEKIAYQAELMEDKIKTKNYHNFEADLSTLKVLYNSFLNVVGNLVT
ncbi:ATP-binding protein [Fulvivirga maritima]|uniref:PAS domain-containing hybrid sensor histidine kinase/response regulator n=1 Tax=Fulvivirga maritima TaxID=2904247 RepID=UPI001F19406C|nr:PAS domain-containing hybrid sensor histidine kinase/response regulator [Fulvivirga maritima]UII29446.1 ATP-binding protein [Fulvivirga maritima]